MPRGLALRRRPIGPGDQLEEVALGPPKIDASAAIMAVDLARAGAVELRVEGGAGLSDAREARIEVSLIDKEGEVARADLVGIDEVERDSVMGADRDEMRPFRSRLQAEDTGKESGGGPAVLGRD